MIQTAKIYFLRHAPVKVIHGFFPKHNPDAIIKTTKLKKLASKIPKNCIWYVSPLKRTMQTASALSKFVNYSKIIKEKQIVEQHFGDWSGKEISEVWRNIKKYKNKHNFSFITSEVIPPGGESFIEQCKRVKSWLEKLNPSEGESIVVITHAGTIRAVLSYVLQINPDNALGIDIVHQSLCIFEMITTLNNANKSGRFRLLALNQEK